MRKVLLEVPSCRITLVGTLLESEDPKVAEIIDDFWNFLEKPVKCFCHPTMSTGDLLNLFPRPPLSPPPSVGDQTSPMIANSPYLITGDGDREVKMGEIIWNGWFPSLVAGPSVTEPLVAGGAKVCTVDKECFNDMTIAQDDLWHHNYLFHKLGIVVLSRKEG